MYKDLLSNYRLMLIEEEKSKNTIERYTKDVLDFLDYIGDKKISKTLVLDYKSSLLLKYKVQTTNAKITSLNSFFHFIKKDELKIKHEKVQVSVFRDENLELTKEEYFRLVDTAYNKKKYSLALILQVLASTGIRVSELKYLTVESVRLGEMHINLKGKNRIVFIPEKLRDELFLYIKEKKIISGMIFLTKNNKEIDRSSLYRQLQNLCSDAKVEKRKVFPHNFRHLFAQSYYEKTKDIVHLSDILGHSSIDTTRIYTMSGKEVFKREINTLDLIL